MSGSGCRGHGTDPDNSASFVGGPENPASDGTYTSRIYSENGIASLEEITLGGEKQWILIRGHDISKPVLIFLHGGPGSACIFYAKYAFEGLEHDFVVVSWDQRGSGKSYHDNIDPGTLTYAQLYSDTHELITKMTARFGVNKVYVMGISWGSILGSNIAKDYPALLYGYVGVGQVVNVARGFELALDATLNEATASNNQAAIAELSAIHPDSTWENMDIIGKWVDALGFGDFHSELRGSQVRDSLASLLTEYTQLDIADLDNGKALYSQSPLSSDLTWLKNIDMVTQIPGYSVPVWFLAGRYDYKSPSQLIEEYYTGLNASQGKHMVWFENSGHVPILEERDLFTQVMKGELLAKMSGYRSR